MVESDSDELELGIGRPEEEDGERKEHERECEEKVAAEVVDYTVDVAAARMGVEW